MTHSFTRRFISSDTAQGILSFALCYALREEWQIAIAVCDPSGVLVAFGRTDGVDSPSVEFAIDKAYTAGTLGKSTAAFGQRMASSPTLSLGLATRSRLIAWGGGVAIFEQDTCIGGLGVSGMQDHQDIACAEAAIKSVGLTPV
ncbi:MAG: GlcG/HbpS family heme-binding protein [Paracoccus sp. (in: a-proteobacteria)]